MTGRRLFSGLRYDITAFVYSYIEFIKSPKKAFWHQKNVFLLLFIFVICYSVLFQKY